MASEQLTITTRVVDRASQQLQQLRQELQQLEQPRNVEVRATIQHELREFERELERITGASREAEVIVRVNRDDWDAFRRDVEEPIDTEVRVDISRGERAAQDLGARFERELRQAVEVVSRVTISVQAAGLGGVGGLGDLGGLGGLGQIIPGVGAVPPPAGTPPFAFVGPRLAPPTALPFVPRDAPFVGPLPAPPTSAPAQRALAEQALVAQLAELDEPITGPPPALPPRAASRAAEEENLQAFLSQFDIPETVETEGPLTTQFTLPSGQEIDLRGAEVESAELLTLLASASAGVTAAVIRAWRAGALPASAFTRQLAIGAGGPGLIRRGLTYLPRQFRDVYGLAREEGRGRLFSAGAAATFGLPRAGYQLYAGTRGAIQDFRTARELGANISTILSPLGRRGLRAAGEIGAGDRLGGHLSAIFRNPATTSGNASRALYRIRRAEDNLFRGFAPSEGIGGSLTGLRGRVARNRVADVNALVREGGFFGRGLGLPEAPGVGLRRGVGLLGLAATGGGAGVATNTFFPGTVPGLPGIPLIGGSLEDEVAAFAEGDPSGQLPPVAAAAAIVGGQQATAQRTAGLLGDPAERREEAIRLLSRVTGLDRASATRLLSIVAEGDPRLVDNAAELYLLVQQALTEQQLGSPATPAQVLDAIQQGLREEGAFFQIAEAGGFPAGFVDEVSLPTLQGAFSGALGLPDQLRIAPDDVRGGTALFRSITAEGVERGLETPRVQSRIRTRAIGNQLQDFSNQISRLSRETQNQNLRASLQRVQNVISSEGAGEQFDAAVADLGQVLTQEGLRTPEFVNVLRAGEDIGLRLEDFERTRAALSPLVRRDPNLIRQDLIAGVDLPATQEGRVVAADVARFEIDRDQAQARYDTALQASGFTQDEVDARAGLTAERIATLQTGDPEQLIAYRQAALDEMIREREEAARQARAAQQRPQRRRSGREVLRARRQARIRARGAELAAQGPLAPDVVSLEAAGIEPALLGAIDARGLALPEDDLSLPAREQLIGAGLEDLFRLGPAVGRGEIGAGGLAAQAGGAAFGRFVGGGAGALFGGPAGAIAGQFAGQAATSLLEEANNWLSGIFGNTAPDRPGLRPEERAFGPQIGSVAAPGAAPIVSEITVNINGNVMGEIDIQEAVQQGVVEGVNNAAALGQLDAAAINPSGR